MKIDRQPGAGTQPRRLLHDACFLWPTPAMTFSLQGASISTYLDESTEIRNQRISRCCLSAIQLLTCHEFQDSANNFQDLCRLATRRSDVRWPAVWAFPAHKSPSSSTRGRDYGEKPAPGRPRRARDSRSACACRSARTATGPRAAGTQPALETRASPTPWGLEPQRASPGGIGHDVVTAAKCPGTAQFQAALNRRRVQSAVRLLVRHNTLAASRPRRDRMRPPRLTPERDQAGSTTRPAAATRPDISPGNTATTRL